MMENFDKRTRAAQLRARLRRAMEQSGISQSALARRIGVDRSTISQVLSGDGARLPNAHVVGACAAALGVSADWLLSLSDRPESAAELLAGSLSLTEAPRALVDQRIFDWHKEAEGYKIRHVPAALPDMLKTRAVMEWEYSPHLGRTAGQARRAMQRCQSADPEGRSQQMHTHEGREEPARRDVLDAAAGSYRDARSPAALPALRLPTRLCALRQHPRRGF